MASDELHTELKKNAVGLLGLMSFSLVNIFPLSFAVTTAATAVVYGGFAAPLVPIFAGLVTLMVSIPIILFSRKIAFAGGYYGFVEAGLGPAVGKFTALIILMYYIMADLSAVIPTAYVLATGLQYMFNYTMPIWIYIALVVLFSAVMLIMTILDVHYSSKVLMVIAFSQIAVGAILALVVIFRTPYNSLDAFNPAYATNGLSGLMLAIMTGGFLTFTGYGAPLFMSEEAKDPQRNVWRSIVLSLITVTLFSTLMMYAEVVAVGASNAASLSSDWNPAVVAFLPYAGFVPTLIFFAIAVIGQLWCGSAVGMAAAREIYAMARDEFLFPKLFAKTHRKYKTPINAALFEFIIVLIAGIGGTLVFYDYFGYSMGIFYSWVFWGALTTFFWVIYHSMVNISYPFFVRKLKDSLLKHVNLAATIFGFAGVIIFILTGYYGYWGIGSPYNYGLYGSFAWILFSLIYVAYKKSRNEIRSSLSYKL
ncbi:MAG: APC family permease [Nitrososphaeria archaeon]